MAWNHRLPDVSDHDSRVAGHATEWMSMRLWSNGYVLYSPSGPVIAVRYEGDKSNCFSDWVTNDKEAEAVQGKLRTLLRVLHSNQSVEKPRNLSEKLAKFDPEPFCSSQLDQYCGPRSLFSVGCLLVEANTDLAPGIRALHCKCHISFPGVVHHRWCQLLPFRVAGASVMNEQKRVRFLRSTRTGFR